MSEAIEIVCDQGPPTEPGLYLVAHDKTIRLAELSRDSEVGFVVWRSDGFFTAICDYEPDARWSRRLNIIPATEEGGERE